MLKAARYSERIGLASPMAGVGSDTFAPSDRPPGHCNLQSAALKLIEYDHSV
jgi:hypothetical protein